jgi:hypothetical protein
MCATLVVYWSSIEIILSDKVKVLRGGICAYGWVEILLYFIWKNEHISLFLIAQTSIGFSQGSLDFLGGSIPIDGTCGHIFSCGESFRDFWALIARFEVIILLWRPPM